MLPRIVALIAAATIVIGLASTVAASLDEPAGSPAQALVQPAYSAEVRGLPTLSPEASMTPEQLSELSGLDLLAGLGRADIVTLQTFASEHPVALQSLVETPPPASAVAQWWASVEPAQRRTIAESLPGTVGNLEGLPYSVRDAANRLHLDRTIAHWENIVGSNAGGRAAQGAAAAHLQMLLEVEKALGSPSQAPPRSLVAADLSWPGRVAVALGDLDVADYVSYLVPGMFFTVTGQVVDWTEIARDVHLGKAAILRNDATGDDAVAAIATVAWLGYETPNVFTVGTLDQAEEGSRQLDATVAGLHAARGSDQPHVSLITHSYGSTAASLSLARGTLDIDAIAIAGSPGVGVESAADLGLPKGAVFVAEAAWDPIVDTAFHGADPGNPDFGAVLMNVAGGIEGGTGARFEAATGHLGYFAKHSESMHNFALIGLGRGDQVTGVSGAQLLASR